MARLKPEAVPSLHLNNPKNEERSQITESNSNSQESGKNILTNKPLNYNTNIEINEHDDFELLEKNEIKMPSSWIKYSVINNGSKLICFNKMDMITINKVETSVPIIEILVYPDMQFSCNVLNQKINVESIGISGNVILDKYYLEDVLQLIDSHKICIGVPSNDLTSAMVHRDSINSVRHIKCSLLLSKKSRCEKCGNIRRNVNSKRKLANENDVSCKKTRFSPNMSMHDKQKVLFLQKKLKSTQKVNAKLKENLEKMKQELNEVCEKISHSDKQIVENAMLNLNISHHQREAVQQILAATKHGNAK